MENERCSNCGHDVTDTNLARSCANCGEGMCDNCWYGSGAMCALCDEDEEAYDTK